MSSYIEEKNICGCYHCKAVPAYFYYENVRRTMRTASVSYLLNE